MKQQCCACKEFKDHSKFGKDKRRPTGLKSRCRDCELEYMRLWKERNRNDFNEYMRQYRQRRKEQGNPILWTGDKEKRQIRNQYYRKNNRELLAERMRLDRAKRPAHYKEIVRRSYYKNREVLNIRSRIAYQKNAEERKEKVGEYRRKNKDRVLKWNKNRRIRQANIPGSHTLEQWKQLCSFFGDICPRCGEKRRLTLDHIIPISSPDSTDWITNIQPLCRSCNSSKNNADTTDYRPEYVKAWALGQIATFTTQ